MINTIRDNIILTKDAVRSRLFARPCPPLAAALVEHLNLKSFERFINGKPNIMILLTKDAVIKMPLDESSEARCKVNNDALVELQKTSIASFTPKPLGGGSFEAKRYYIESRVPGVAIDLPISKMGSMVNKAAEFIGKFHRETARDTVIDDLNFKRIFACDFERLYPHLDAAYKAKLEDIEMYVKGELLGKSFRTVWFHGDYKIENILFDKKSWNIRGVIDWDLSRREGLPISDIFYLLAYKSSLLTKASISSVFKNMFLSSDFIKSDEDVSTYRRLVDMDNSFIRPIIITFWMNHITQRYGSKFTNNILNNDAWFNENVCNIIDNIKIGR